MRYFNSHLISDDRVYFLRSGTQVFYLIDEKFHTVGKEANCVTSLLHHHVEHLGFWERHAVMHLDNCSRQNKINTLIGLDGDIQMSIHSILLGLSKCYHEMIITVLILWKIKINRCLFYNWS